MHACMYVCMYVRMYMYMYMYMYVCVYIYIYMCIYVYVYICKLSCDVMIYDSCPIRLLFCDMRSFKYNNLMIKTIDNHRIT